MVIAIMMESEMKLPDDLLEAIIDKVSVWPKFIFYLLCNLLRMYLVI